MISRCKPNTIPANAICSVQSGANTRAMDEDSVDTVSRLRILGQSTNICTEFD